MFKVYVSTEDMVDCFQELDKQDRIKAIAHIIDSDDDTRMLMEVVEQSMYGDDLASSYTKTALDEIYRDGYMISNLLVEELRCFAKNQPYAINSLWEKILLEIGA